MTLAREEIFGPVLVVMPYRTEDEALNIANDSIFDLGGYVFTENRKKGYEFSCGLRAGWIRFNGANTNSYTPMGGYKQSGGATRASSPRLRGGLASEAAVPKTVMIDESGHEPLARAGMRKYSKAHRTATGLRSKKECPTIRGAA